MNIGVTVTRENDDKLARETWIFRLIDDDLVLNSYARETRSSLRHKFQAESPKYERLYQRNTLPEAAVPFPADVVEEARERFIAEVNARLRVGRWGMDLKRG